MATALEFGLLGPLIVRCGTASVQVARGKQRAVLAALLFRANRVVPQSELAEVLWGPGLPRSARVTLQNYIKRLRHALGLAAGRISTHPQGYMIAVGTDELDISQFERLVGSAGAAAKVGSWPRALARADGALELWRGEPLADIDSEMLALREAPRLDEMRLQALETRFNANLQLGGHAEVIPELQSLTRVYPLRENFQALLLLALYRSGRQAEALSTYQATRRLLVCELGIEPGIELRELHQRILAADPSLQLRGKARV
jgi:DNA-binding SARP family transcriptional activator